jgi:hypothetical protein
VHGIIVNSPSPLLLSTVVILFAGIYTSVCGQECIRYGPTVSVAGVLISKTFPGPPNYESIKHGDRKERANLVRLASSICVEGSDDVDIAEKQIRIVQLVVTEPSHWELVERSFGKRVVVEGSLFHAHTGHHRTKLLVQVTDIKRY